MPVTQARLPGFQSAKSARWYQALIGPIQATGSAGGFDYAFEPIFFYPSLLRRIFSLLWINNHSYRNKLKEDSSDAFDPWRKNQAYYRR